MLYFAGFTSAIGVLFGSRHAGSRVMYNTAGDGLAPSLFMVVFIVTNVATIPYFWRHQRKQFSWIRHCVIPLLGVVAFGYPLYASVLPSQEAPYNWFWVLILIGIVLSVLWGLVRRHKSEVGQRLAVDE